MHLGLIRAPPISAYFCDVSPAFRKIESHDTVAEQFIEILAATGVKTCSSAEKNCCHPPLAPW
jgi:hypothetical protein